MGKILQWSIAELALKLHDLNDFMNIVCSVVLVQCERVPMVIKENTLRYPKQTKRGETRQELGVKQSVSCLHVVYTRMFYWPEGTEKPGRGVIV